MLQGPRSGKVSCSAGAFGDRTLEAGRKTPLACYVSLLAKVNMYHVTKTLENLDPFSHSCQGRANLQLQGNKLKVGKYFENKINYFLKYKLIKDIKVMGLSRRGYFLAAGSMLQYSWYNQEITKEYQYNWNRVNLHHICKVR